LKKNLISIRALNVKGYKCHVKGEEVQIKGRDVVVM